MATASMTDAFTIVVDGPNDLNVVRNIALTRPLRILSMKAIVAQNTSTTLSVWKVNTAGVATLVTANPTSSAAATAYVASAGSLQASNICEVNVYGPNASLFGGDNLRVQAGNTLVVAVIIECLGLPAIDLVVT